MLWQAIAQGDLALLQKALELGASPDSAYGKWTALGKAIRSEHPDIAKALIEAGANLATPDQGFDLATLTASHPKMTQTLALLLKKGAPFSQRSLRVAARGLNSEAVDILVAAGAASMHEDVSLGRPIAPALCDWASDAPPPKSLVEATFSAPVDNKRLKEIVSNCARFKRPWLLDALIERRGEYRPLMATLLSKCLNYQWDEAVDRLLEKDICDPRIFDPYEDHPLVQAANRIRHDKKKKPAWARMRQLLDYGFEPNAIQMEFCIARGDNQDHYYAPVPAWLEAIRKGPNENKKALIDLFAQYGARLDARFGENGRSYAGGGLIHLLVDKGDFETARRVCKTHAATWEDQCGVMASWVHTCPTSDIATQMEHLLSMGFDARRRDSEGSSVLRTFIRRCKTNMFMPKIYTIKEEQLGEFAPRLLSAGLDPSLGQSGMDDFEFAIASGVDPKMVSDWQAMFIQENSTAPAASSRMKARL